MQLKWIPRNASAARLKTAVVGNPASSRPEAGVGNCFPGLECDLRNLERRFFPRLEVDITSYGILVVGVDAKAPRHAKVPAKEREALARIARDVRGQQHEWWVESIASSFGPFGEVEIKMRDLVDAGAKAITDKPADPWTCVRLIPEGHPITLVLVRRPKGTRGVDAVRSGEGTKVTLTGAREKYLDDSGALAAMFEPGELTQSLCAPWTHDFRDCGCYYWASNHPDIVKPALPEDVAADDQDWDRLVPWERSNRGVEEAPDAALPSEEDTRWMDHIEINQRWQELDIVVEGREERGPYKPGGFKARPLASDRELEAHLRYAAGVELAVIQEYLSAAFSIDVHARDKELRQDVESARAEMMRIIVGEMRHLRLANDVLFALSRAQKKDSFEPALRVAQKVPSGKGGGLRDVAFRPLTAETLDDFLNIERPSTAVDGLYARILATLEERSDETLQAAVRSIMSDGADHFATFGFIREWLTRWPEETYLKRTRRPAKNEPLLRRLRAAYASLVGTLYKGYAAGLPAGAAIIADARAQMLDERTGIQAICERLTDKGFSVVFDFDLGERFRSIPPPRP